MDRMAQTALNSLKMMMENQAATAHNLANVNTPGFRQDVATDFSSIFLNRANGIEPRIVSARNIGGFSLEQGQMENTQNPMDVAIQNEGYFIIKPKNNGDNAFSRRGDFQLNENTELVDGAGNQVLDAGLQPIVLPPFSSMNIASNGQITIQPIGGDVNAPPIEVAIIGTAIPIPEQELKKSLDGNIRYTDENTVIESNQQAKLLTGFLEKSNVNAIDEMVNSLDQQRKFEMHVKFIQMTEELDNAGASLIRLPGM
ncbi:flagellar hook-basal body complex protein [Rickettsiales bacterium]|nr:flagellar hook-basal body complex protein [Rickettsiales bacterium]